MYVKKLSYCRQTAQNSALFDKWIKFILHYISVFKIQGRTGQKSQTSMPHPPNLSLDILLRSLLNKLECYNSVKALKATSTFGLGRRR